MNFFAFDFYGTGYQLFPLFLRVPPSLCQLSFPTQCMGESPSSGERNGIAFSHRVMYVCIQGLGFVLYEATSLTDLCHVFSTAQQPHCII